MSTPFLWQTPTSDLRAGAFMIYLGIDEEWGYDS